MNPWIGCFAPAPSSPFTSLPLLILRLGRVIARTSLTVALPLSCGIEAEARHPAVGSPGNVGETVVQQDTVAVGILGFSDDSGTGLPDSFREFVAREFQKKLITKYKNLAPRKLSSPAAPPGDEGTVEQAAALGKRYGLQYVIRGGILLLASEKSGSDVTFRIELFADVVSVESTAMVSVRAEGSETRSPEDQEIALATADFAGERFRTSSTGMALGTALDNLAASVYETVLSAPSGEGAALPDETGAQPAGQMQSGEEQLPLPQEEPEETEDAREVESDEDLQQLMAQAEECLAGAGSSSVQELNGLRNALEGLRSSLERKSRLLQEGTDTNEMDREIDSRKEALSQAILRIQETSSYGTEYRQEEQSSQKQSVLKQIMEFLGSAVDFAQRIGELRAGWTSFRSDSIAEQLATDAAGREGGEIRPDLMEQRDESLEEITGTVIEDGRPVQGAVVTESDSGASATTASDGSYTIDGIAGNLATLIVSRNGRELAKGRIQVAPGRPRVADFQLSASRIGGFQRAIPALRIIPSVVNVGRKIPGNALGTVEGTVQSAEGNPVPRALIQLQNLAIARTDSRGRYMFRQVPAGTYALVTRRSGYPAKSAQVRVTAGGKVDSSAVFRLSEQMRRVRSSLVIQKGDRTSGVVLRGQLIDQTSHPISGAKVTLAAPGAALSVRTDSNGRYLLRNLKPGDYRLIAAMAGKVAESRDVTLRGADMRDMNIQLRNTPGSGSYVLAGARAHLRGIRGEVCDSHHKPLPKVQIEVRKAGKSAIVERILTNQRGEYLLKVYAGTYDLSVSRPGYDGTSRKVSVGSGDLTAVDFALSSRTSVAKKDLASFDGRAIGDSGRNRRIQQRLPSPVLLHGRISTENGKPVPHADVFIDGRRLATTDTDGRFSLRDLPPGHHGIITLRIVEAGYRPVERKVKIRPGVATFASVVLSAQGRR